MHDELVDVDPVQVAAAAYAAGRSVLLAGESFGTLMVCRPSAAGEARVNEMVTDARGLVCVAITGPRAETLGLVFQSDHSLGPRYTNSIEASVGVTTGISAADRARTIEVMVSPDAGPDDVVSPGHLFPVVAHAAGVFAVRGAAEAVIDLARIAGSDVAAGVYCHVLSETGDEVPVEQAASLGQTLDLPVLRVEQLVRHRTLHEPLVRELEAGRMVPTAQGTFEVSVWEELLSGTQHMLLRAGETELEAGVEAPLVRVHSQCLTGDVFRSRRCDCGAQLESALTMVRESGHGAVLYLRQEGRGIGLVGKLKAYELQDRGRDTVEANQELGFEPDLREYDVGAQILLQSGYRRIRLLTNNPRKVRGLSSAGLTVEARVSLEAPANPANERYLRAKKEKLGHLLNGV